MSESTSHPPTETKRSGMSLARRLLLVAALWGVLVLVGGALALSAIYRAQTLSVLEEDLDQTLVQLTREMTVQGAFLDNGRVTNTDRIFMEGDARYQTPLSGRYWAIVGINADNQVAGDLRSDSLWDGDVPVSGPLLSRVLANPGEVQFGDAEGPAEESVRVAARSLLLEGRGAPLVLVAAADRTANDDAARRFRNLLVGTMIALFSGVFAAMVAGIQFSLRPLRRIREDISRIREGERMQLGDDYPAEVMPLTEELNKLLDHNKDVVERARTHVGNLAHALKTPLAVLRNEATGDDQLSDVVRRQTEAMHANVEHYLKRARAAARAETLGARTDVTPAVDSLARLFNRLHEGKSVFVEGDTGTVFRGEQQDFEEMLGNLMDNACKWAERNVTVTIRGGDGALTIDVDDDGPGLSPDQRIGALKRGVRLDETTPGTGLGLSIVTELAEMHKGKLMLDDSPEGGLRARLRFEA